MNKEAQIEAFQKLDGWIHHYDTIHGEHVDEQVYGWHRKGSDDIRKLPNYLESYDAIIPILKKLDGKTQRDFELALNENGFLYFWDASPAQIAEIILRVLKLWIPER